MAKASNAVIFSPSCDVTGKAIAERLGFTPLTKWDGKERDVVICYGWSGVKQDGFDTAAIEAKTTTVINTPAAIRANGNKHNAFKRLQDVGVKVPAFFTEQQVEAALAQGKLTLPIVGRTKTHQGGKKFHLCLETAGVKNALKEGCTIFTQYHPVKHEYRMHVMDGEILHAARKKPQDDPVLGWKQGKQELLEKKAAKKGIQIHQPTADALLGLIVDRDLTLPAFGCRSNTKGWKFALVTKYDNKVADAAIKACKALNLHFAAVDCIVTDQDEVIVLEANTGPGLCNTMLDRYEAGLKKLAAPKVKAANKFAFGAGKGNVAAQQAGAAYKPNVKKPRKTMAARLRAMSAEERAGILDLVESIPEDKMGALERLLALDE